MPIMVALRAAALAVAITIALFALGACNGGTDQGDGGIETPTATVAPSPTVPPPVPDETKPPRPPQPERPETAQEVQTEVTEPDPVQFRLEISAEDNFFTKNNLRMRSGDPVTLFVSNEGSNQHTLRIAGVDGKYETGDDFASPVINPGDIDGQSLVDLDTPGTYSFRCDTHPAEMFGQITVVE